MEDGVLNKIKIGFIIQARLGSSRLPRKVIEPISILNNKSPLDIIIESLQDATFDNDIIIATTINKEDDEIIKLCNQKKVNYFRGSELDVLSRFVSIILNNHFDVVVRITADNPIIDIDTLEKTIKTHLLNKNDYTYTTNMPIGMNFEVFNPDALLVLSKDENLKAEDKEHVTIGFRKNSIFKIETIYVEINEEFKKFRLTLDYPIDYLLIATLFQFSYLNNLNGLKLIEFVFNKYPWILYANDSVFQKNHLNSSDRSLEFISATLILRKLEYFRTATIIEAQI